MASCLIAMFSVIVIGFGSLKFGFRLYCSRPPELVYAPHFLKIVVDAMTLCFEESWCMFL